MSEDILQELQVILQNNLNSKKQIQEILEYMKKYYLPGRWIYPGALKRKFSLDVCVVYSILSQMEQKGLLTSYFEVICNKCSHTIGDVYHTLDEIPEFVSCDNCEQGEEIVACKYACLIYRVNVDAEQWGN